MNQNTDIINSYISFIEKVANGKQNYLDFKEEGMSFYRREIHIIKMIGDNEGIYTQEIATALGITRAVVHKIVNKLEDRELIEKATDNNDKKIKRLSLSEKGKRAYQLHQEYHNQSDEPFFEFINNLNEEESKVIKEFLERANIMVEKHF